MTLHMTLQTLAKWVVYKALKNNKNKNGYMTLFYVQRVRELSFLKNFFSNAVYMYKVSIFGDSPWGKYWTEKPTRSRKRMAGN